MSLQPNKPFLRHTEVRLLLLAAALVTAAFTLTQMGLDFQEGRPFDWPSVAWTEIVFWYGLLLLAGSAGLSLIRRQADQFLLPLVGLLAGLSLMLMYRLPTPAGWDADRDILLTATGNMWYVRRQALMLMLGLGVMLAMAWWPGLVRWLRDHRRITILLGLGLLLGTALWGVPAAPGGPRVSLSLGVFQFQPAELVKLLFVIYLAGYLHHVRDDFNRFTYRYFGVALPVINYLLPMALLLAGAIIFLVLMSDLGAAIILIGVFPILVYTALRPAVVRRLVLLFGLLLLGVYFTLVQVQDHTRHDISEWLRQPDKSLPAPAALSERVVQGIDRVAARVEIWQDPWQACAAGSDCASYQTLQSLYAVSAGGVWGVGPGFGQFEHIPAVFTDLVYAAIAEEWGLLGAGAVLLLYWLLVRRSLQIARRQTESFRALLATGIGTIFALQCFTIIGGTLNIIPLTGITVPFLSYGGTSILVNALMIGLLLRLSAGSNRQLATAATRANISRVRRLFGFGFILLGIGLAYWTLWMHVELHPAYPTHNARSGNPAAQQRQAAWLAQVERGQIRAGDGTIIAGDGAADRLNYVPSLGHVIGQTTPQGLGLNGLEYAYNDVLLGRGRYDLDTLFARQRGEPWAGNHLQLTIDLDWQQAAHEGLGAYNGAVVALDADTGAVLAMVSHPLYDPAQPDAGAAANSQLNRAISGLYPPGSTFKAVIGALALEEGLATPDSTFDFGADEWYWQNDQMCHQQVIGGGQITSCNTTLQQMTFREGFAWSDNILFAQLAGQLGPQRVGQGAARLGFGRPLEFDLPVAVSRVAADEGWLDDPAQLAMTGFGQSQVTATPLHMALVAATIANGGWLPQPYLVGQVLRPDGSMLQETAPQSWNWILSGSTAGAMADVMEAAVTDGWASGAAVPSLRVGGKTGTAEWSGSVSGQSLPHAWFIGFADMPDGRTIAIAVLAEEAGEGGAVAAPIAGYIFEQMSQTLVYR